MRDELQINGDLHAAPVHIKNGRLIDPKTGIDAKLDLFIADGRIAAIGQPPPGFKSGRTIDAGGRIVCPGLVDPGDPSARPRIRTCRGGCRRRHRCRLPARHQAATR